MNAVTITLIAVAALGWILLAWVCFTRPSQPEPQGHLTIHITRGKRGRFRWVMRNVEGRVVAVSSPQGYEAEPDARRAAIALCIAPYRFYVVDAQGQDTEQEEAMT